MSEHSWASFTQAWINKYTRMYSITTRLSDPASLHEEQQWKTNRKMNVRAVLIVAQKAGKRQAFFEQSKGYRLNLDIQYVPFAHGSTVDPGCSPVPSTYHRLCNGRYVKYLLKKKSCMQDKTAESTYYFIYTVYRIHKHK
ncbi:uncharacterized protein LOC123518342 [Portunus trituberculatus]|uniref:uncharacterized protein LOC123518342 n=1 Tax=Portunus trituberculatus TaxID=210409 RepID=UPI001E1CB491|nr:uncharacterized protein LOC123518342 [Portunus trituberculatus]